MVQKKTGQLWALFGPTAVGKTALSFYLADKLSAGILNCDSISMYKGLDIGSAKPVKEIQSGRYPLFLFNEWEPPQVGTGGAFKKKAEQVLQKELPKRSILMVGASGFYAKALETGMYPVRPVAEEIKIRLNVEQERRGIEGMYQWLKGLDPEYAKSISNKDRYRIYRALSLILSENKSMSVIRSLFQQKAFPFISVKVGLYLPRDQLLKRVKIRTKNMIQAGLLEETKALLNKGFAHWPLLKSVGYKESILYLQNQISFEELTDRIVQRTMQLAKKQMSWFKRDKSIQWYLSEKNSQQAILKLLRNN